MSNFRVGQKVVCVDTRWIVTSHKEIVPVKNVVYTIRSVEIGYQGLPVIRLVEIINEPHQYSDGFKEARFIARRFRPIVTRKTDISVFKAMLTDERVGV